jgi:hypothetical protein
LKGFLIHFADVDITHNLYYLFNYILNIRNISQASNYLYYFVGLPIESIDIEYINFARKKSCLIGMDTPDIIFL